MSLQRELPALVLASASAARAKLLRDAGLRFTVVPASFDEAGARRAACKVGRNAAEAALELAEGKALLVSGEEPEAMVLGADQVLACEGAWFKKPASREEAAEQLRALRGREHRLVSAVACATAGKVCWSHVSEARLHFRNFSDEVLSGVLEADEAAIGTSVGGYRLEGPGVLLCQAIKGDHFTILGLPLLPLLQFLRGVRVLID